jgi:hypothetical protein
VVVPSAIVCGCTQVNPIHSTRFPIRSLRFAALGKVLDRFPCFPSLSLVALMFPITPWLCNYPYCYPGFPKLRNIPRIIEGGPYGFRDRQHRTGRWWMQRDLVKFRGRVATRWGASLASNDALTDESAVG